MAAPLGTTCFFQPVCYVYQTIVVDKVKVSSQFCLKQSDTVPLKYPINNITQLFNESF